MTGTVPWPLGRLAAWASLPRSLALRVLSGNSTPDHVTIARFRVRHEHALAGLLVQSLRLSAAAGMVRLGLVALDGTKIEANAAAAANRTHAHLEQQVAELLARAAEADRLEDRQHGAARGDELPRALAGRTERLARLQQAKAQLEAEAAARQRRYQQRVADLAAAARARGQRPRAHIRPRRRDEAPNPAATVNTTDPKGSPRSKVSSPARVCAGPSRSPDKVAERGTLTAASCVATGGPCRATTPRRPPPSG